ncbi:hypothetical protein [Clostridium sp. LIBA-8841]|uniref:hypothetical protein n=1 Tax=Clostridium sp. LIBA-8841 TaxID=2987530 RepID=UPI002AC700EF|nr:hypothetical protein [Clostridium sp. LIBA-8841]MDZ5253170.1 hypothetical protein [Clostridium sp. LIBA-8841]
MNQELEIFLNKNNIEVLPRKEITEGKKEIKLYDTREYINTINELHHIFLKENNKIRFKFRNDIWRIVQTFKLWNRRAERININNSFFRLVIEASKKSVNSIESIDYISLIKRAMEREEVCTGRIYYEIKEGYKKVFITNLDNIKFNMREDDYYTYFKKIKGIYKNELDDLIKVAVEKEELDFKSYIYIKALIEYPYNSMKYLQDIYVKDIEFENKALEGLLARDYLI